jgi:hypothetical protein
MSPVVATLLTTSNLTLTVTRAEAGNYCLTT